MKTFKVILTRSYSVVVKADSQEQAKHVAEFYTSHIKDISIDNDRKKFKFSIEEIECVMNESFEAEELKNK